MDLEKLRRLTQNMENVNEGSTNGISEDESARLNRKGMTFYKQKNYGLAVQYWKKAAKNGNVVAMVNLGIVYEEIYEDHKESFKWYKKAAESGDAESMFEIGIYYYRGEYVEKDVFKSFGWCKKAAENGIVNAMDWTGCFYRDGEGVQQNFQEAIKWFKKSADGGNPYAAKNLLDELFSKLVKNLDVSNVPLDFLKNYAKNSNDPAPLLLCAYKIGLQDVDEGYTWYKKALDKGAGQLLNNYTEHYKEFAGAAISPALMHNVSNISNNVVASFGRGCFITTAVCDSFGKADDCYELTAFRNFRDKWLALQADGKNLIAEYYEVAPKIVEKINSLSNSAEIYKNIWRDYLSACLKSIEVGNNENCKKIYVEMVNTLKEKFLK